MKNKVIIVVVLVVVVLAVVLSIFFINKDKDIVFVVREGNVQDNSYVQLAWSGLKKTQDRANIELVASNISDGQVAFEELYKKMFLKILI